MNDSKKVIRVGIDLGKNVFHLIGVNSAEKEVLRKKLKRKDFLKYIANLPHCLIVMEACGGANHWAREIIKLGHEVRLIAPQHVKPYVNGNKNDFNDAAGICEAASRPKMRYVAIRTIEQQDIQALHRIRQSLIKSRTALSSQIRGLLAEYGIVVGRGLSRIRRRIPELLEDAENGLTMRFRRYLAQQLDAFRNLDKQIAEYSKEIKLICREDEACVRIKEIPGLGAQGATAIVAAYGKASQYKDGRRFAASLGLVPRQHTTGDKPVLMGITKRGDSYIRTLLIHGARAVITHLGEKQDKRSRWLRKLVERRGVNRAAVALANKNARIIWAMLQSGERYRPSEVAS
jgi:transposase